MSQLYNYFQSGFYHIFNFNSLEVILFISLLTIVLTFNEWQKTLVLISLFVLGHIITTLLFVFEIVYINKIFVRFLISSVILLTAIYNIFFLKKSTKYNQFTIIDLSSLFFGILYGLVYSNVIKTVVIGTKFIKPLVFLAIGAGIETAAIVLGFSILLLSYILQTVFKTNKRDLVLVFSSLIIGLVLPVIFRNKFL